MIYNIGTYISGTNGLTPVIRVKSSLPVTCKLGSKTIASKIVDGYYVFEDLELGTYTVSNSLQSKSVVVNKTARWTIGLKTMLYDSGNEYSAITGGWVGDSVREAGSGPHYARMFKTTNAIDFEGYSSLHILYSSSGKDSAGEFVEVASEFDHSYGNILTRGTNLEYTLPLDGTGSGNKIFMYVWQSGSTNTIEKLSDSLHIYAAYTSSYTRELYVYKVWLE